MGSGWVDRCVWVRGQWLGGQVGVAVWAVTRLVGGQVGVAVSRLSVEG